MARDRNGVTPEKAERYSDKEEEKEEENERKSRKSRENSGSDSEKNRRKDGKSRRKARESSDSDGERRKGKSRRRYSSEEDSSSDSESEYSDSQHSGSNSESESSGSEESESESERRRKKRKETKRRREKEEARDRKRRRIEKERKRRRREREEERKKKEKRKKKKKEKEKRDRGKTGAVTNLWGKYGIIREADMWNKRPEFTAWLAEVKQVNLESLPNWEEKQMFKQFMEDHNTATFPSKKLYFKMSQDSEAKHSTQTEIRRPRRTISPRFNPDEDGRRRATLMRRVHQVKTKGERLEVSFDSKGQPIGNEGDVLQSWISVLAREHIPIWISDFRSADLAQRKERVWMEIVTAFTVDASFRKQALKSCAESAKNFRYDLYQTFVRDHIEEENVWQRPPKVVHNYPTISPDDWEKFIEYRRIPEFKRLSEQGSEIRKKSKYGSTGGRDEYKKRDQAHFEKSGKWAERHENWLQMRIKPDGSLKNEAFKNIVDSIDDFSEQQTQGSFESGTEDILTKALGNVEHSGRIRDQSKFVKQAQFFGSVGSSRDNAEVLEMKRRLAALKITIQELCAKHSINRETMAEEPTAPTVDQHNSFKNIVDSIDDFSEQQTQGSFESVGTEDILTKALGNVEHSGRIRGQSKFDKQAQFFGSVGSSRDNAEVLEMKRQLAALKITVQELCAKHGINRETMSEEPTAPTVDQHNSFKASCTLNEKADQASDPKTMPNASKECHLFIPDLINGGDVLVANGRAYMDCVPTDTVHGILVGDENVRVTITVPKLKGALLPIPTHEATCIEEAVGGFVAWPKRLVVVQPSLSQASKCPSHAHDREAGGSKRIKKRAGRKKIHSQLEVQQPAQREMPSFDFSEIPMDLRPLAYYAQNSMRDGTQIMCPLQQFVIGDDMPIYIGFEDVYHFITFKEINANSIMVYIRYLADCCARSGMAQRVEFISPVLVSPVQQNVDRAAYVRERADYILRILRNATKGKLFLMPYNSGQHWILAVIDPWDDLVLYFNPLGNEPGDDFKALITTALNDWKTLVGRGIRQRRNWETLIDTVRCPLQEGYVECSYFVLAFMREITSTVDGLAALQMKDFYTDADMSLVRQEWATFVMRFIQY